MTARCPVCGKAADATFKPFCGRGCKDRDLLQWLDEGYRIRGPAADPDLPDTGLTRGVDNDGGAD